MANNIVINAVLVVVNKQAVSVYNTVKLRSKYSAKGIKKRLF